jgi:hypothetical protein
MSTRRTKTKIDWLVGTWYYKDAVSPILFTITTTPAGLRIKATDQSDSEELTVSKIKWDGKILTFETLTPSNKWRTRNRLKVISKTKATHELTFWEPWEKILEGQVCD